MTEAWLEELSHEECLDLLRPRQVGRIAFVSDDAPVVFPINYRLVETAGPTWLALRTRPGNVIDQAPMKVAFQIDGIEPFQPAGWSVLVRGTLHRVDRNAAGFEERFNPEPWLVAERDAWLVIEPFAVTGRRLHAPEPEWAFHLAAYL